jgi:hypothetical protein
MPNRLPSADRREISDLPVAAFFGTVASPRTTGSRAVKIHFRFLTATFALLVLGAASTALAVDFIRVEEDWELVLGEPDTNSVGPQVVTTMSPNDNIGFAYFTMEVNHRSAPTWTPGGISIHRWSGEFRMGSFDRDDRTVMATNDETVTWTQALYVEAGRLHFKIMNGASTTWGPFGYSQLVKLDCSWGVLHINSYTPAVSMAHSGPAYAGNRVQTLKIKQIRYTLSDLTTFTDSTERVVHQLVE